MASYALDGYAVRGTLVRNTTQAPMVASVRDACFESISRPANARRELQPVRPTAPPLDGPHGMPLPRRSRQSYGERKSIHAGGCTRLRKQWPERGPHAGEGFVRTPRLIGFVRTPSWRGFRQDPCWRGFRQDPMLERVSSGPHAGEGFVAEKHDSKCGLLNKQAAVEWGHGLKGAHARRRGCTPGRAPRRAPWREHARVACRGGRA